MLLECLPLGLVGGALGLLLALWGIDLLAALLPPSLPRHNEIGVSGRVLAFTSALSLLTVLIFGLLPARQSARADLREALNKGGRGGAGSHRQGRVRRLLVITEVALALVLLSGAGLLARSFGKLRQVDTGFTACNVLTLRVALPDAKYPTPISITDPCDPAGLPFFERLLERVRSLPGVEAAAAGTLLPLGAGQGWGKNMSIEGRPAPTLDQTPLVRFALISPDYFLTLGIAVRQGRAFAATDREQTQPVAIINETLARRYFPGEDPVGKTIWLGVPEHLLPPEQQTPQNRVPRRLIIGVVADVKGGSLNQPPLPLVYAPLTQYRREGWSNTLMLAVQTSQAPESLAAAIRAEVRALDPDQPVTNVRTIADLLSQSLAAARFSLLLLGLFAGVALVLAGLGIYGVMAHTVAQRTHEIGIRLALGAQQRDVLRMVAKQGMALTLIGLAVGLVSALALTRLMATLLFGVTATDPLTFAGVVLLLVAVALVACWLPARRAAQVDPLIALRCD
jgi:putative ABC transport system permease protein